MLGGGRRGEWNICYGLFMLSSLVGTKLVGTTFPIISFAIILPTMLDIAPWVQLVGEKYR